MKQIKRLQEQLEEKSVPKSLKVGTR